MLTSDVPHGPFADALLDPCRALPPGLTTWNGSAPESRFGVYRNNVVSALVAALAETFPVTQQLVGEEFFRWMARHFVMAEPPRSPVLSEYGDTFPAFVAAFEPAAALGYLADVARLERLRVRIYHAADSEPLPVATLALQLEQPERLLGARIALAPSLAVLTSSHAVVSLWSAHQNDAPLAELPLNHAESALIVRDRDDVLVIALPAATASFIGALATGETLGAAASRAVEHDSSFDPTQALALLIRHGAIVAWLPPGDPKP